MDPLPFLDVATGEGESLLATQSVRPPLAPQLLQLTYLNARKTHAKHPHRRSGGWLVRLFLRSLNRSVRRLHLISRPCSRGKSDAPAATAIRTIGELRPRSHGPLPFSTPLAPRERGRLITRRRFTPRLTKSVERLKRSHGVGSRMIVGPSSEIEATAARKISPVAMSPI
jgi:hypothetical protein